MDLKSSIEELAGRRWVVDELQDALAVAKKLNGKGIQALISYTGTQLARREDMDAAIKTVEATINTIARDKLNAEISVRTTQLGILQNKAFIEAFYESIVRKAKKKRVFVWLDMERAEYVTDTIWLYRNMMSLGNTGIALQSYLRRSMKDLQELVASGAAVRLVKGDFRGTISDKEMVFRGNQEVTQNYMDMMEYLFMHSKKRFVIATHDPQIIDAAIGMHKKYRARFMFGMLYGMRNRYASQLAGKGYGVQIYVSYGREWLEYSMTRLGLRHNANLVLRSLMEDQKLE